MFKWKCGRETAVLWEFFGLNELKDFFQRVSLFTGQKILHSTKLSCVGSCLKHFFFFVLLLI